MNDAPALSEYDAKQLLAGFGVPVSKEKVVATADEAVAAAAEIGHPTVLKLSGAEIMHKTEIGGVRLNLVGDDDPAGVPHRLRRLVQPSRRQVGEAFVAEIGADQQRRDSPC